MNSCEKYFDSIDDLVEGELDERTAEQTSSHVFACSSCRQRYETLRREKRIYARYLLEAEPPIDLWTNFQARLAAEQEKAAFATAPPEIFPTRKTSAFGFPRFAPLLAGAAVLLVVFAVGWLRFAPSETNSGGQYAARTEQNDSPSATKSGEVERSETTDSAENIKGGESGVLEENGTLDGKNDKSKTLKAKSVSVADKKPIAAEALKTEQKTDFAKAGKKSVAAEKSNAEEQAQRRRLRHSETEIADQIERVELLLRSFRNARASEANESFDVGYEKAQARRLLEKNARLRLEAENYGIGHAEELLSRVEPYLLDIANLEDQPAPEKVLDIKDRVSNQNIIASLQVY